MHVNIFNYIHGGSYVYKHNDNNINDNNNNIITIIVIPQLMEVITMAITVITATTARKITWPPPDFSGVFLVDTSGPWHRQCFKAKAELHGYPMF